jgi:hypothetical protein
MNYTTLFYWLVVADNAKNMFKAGLIFFSIVALIATVAYILCTEEGSSQSMARKWMWWAYPFVILFWSLYIFTPSKRDALLIVAGGQTLNFLANDKSAKQIPAELSNFVLTEIKNQAKEAAVDLNISSQKDKILEKAKKMSAAELMTEMKKDTTFARVILEDK